MRLKTIPLVLSLVTLVLFTSACSKEPKVVAKEFTINLSQGKISEAKKSSTEQTAALLDVAMTMGKLMVDHDVKFIFEAQEITENAATVRFRKAPEGRVEVLHLVKIDSEWKIDITFADQISAKVRKNLQQIDASAAQFYLEKGTNTAKINQLVGPDLYMKKLDAIDGEDYSKLDLSESVKKWEIETKSGVYIVYPREFN